MWWCTLLDLQPIRFTLQPAKLFESAEYAKMHAWADGRLSCVGHEANEIIMVPQYKIAYVVVRKAASSTMQHMLRAVFGASQNKCGRSAVGACGEWPAWGQGEPRRCTANCLTSVDLEGYFVFSVVRHPVKRFYSSLYQASLQDSVPMEISMLNGDRVANTLRQWLANNFTRRHGDAHGAEGYNQHFETQIMSLTSPLQDGAPVSIDFIGRSENLEGDLKIMFDAATRKTGILVQSTLVEKAIRAVQTLHRDSKGVMHDAVAALRSPLINTLVQAAYDGDIRCLYASLVEENPIQPRPTDATQDTIHEPDAKCMNRLHGLKRKMQMKDWNPAQRRMMRNPQRFRKAATIVDVGAYIGVDLQRFVESGPPEGLEVWAFEPVPSIFKRLHTNVQKYEQIHIERLGLGASNATSCFVTKGDATREVPIDHSDCSERSKIVDVVEVARWFPRIDLLHLNCEGCEGLVLLRLLETDMETIDAIEVQFHETVSHEQYCELELGLRQHGFQLEYQFPYLWDLWVKPGKK